MVLERYFPSLPIRYARMIESGWDNYVLEVNDQWIFRFPRRQDGVVRLKMEIKLLPLISRISSIRVPEFEYLWPGGGDFREVFVGYKRIQGVSMTAQLVTRRKSARLASQLSGFLREIHDIPPLRLSKIGLFEWHDRQELKRHAIPLLSPKVRLRLVSLFEEFFRDKTNLKFAPTLIHSDLTGGNILCNSDATAITGVIDWGDASIGDPAYDFSGFLYEYGESFVDKILSEYNATNEEAFRRRMIFYASVLPFNVLVGAKMTGHRFQLGEDELVVHEGDKRIHLKLFEYSKALSIT
jgi:aminoglycoside 2''-phosphotransferase